MDIPLGYIIAIATMWFLIYWIIGGALFALIAVFRLGSLKKGQFSCLFSLSTLGIAIGGAYYGAKFGAIEAVECLANANAEFDGFIGFFGCSIVSLMLSFIAGAILVLVIGVVSFLISSRGAELKPQIHTGREVEKQKNESVLS